MRWLSTLPLLGLVIGGAAGFVHERDYDAHDYYAVHLQAGIDAREVSEELGLHYEGVLGELEDHYIFRTRNVRESHDRVKRALSELRVRRRRRDAGIDATHILDSILLTQKQELHTRFPLEKRGSMPASPRDAQDAKPHPDEEVAAADAQGKVVAAQLGITDPIFQEQWHLHNAVQVGHDINVTGVWLQGITGKNSTVCFVDDGLDFGSDDLQGNYFAKGSYDFNDPGPDPLPRLNDDTHGTRCAGEVSAVRNDVCGVGIAYDGKVSGVRILSKAITDADEAIAMNFASQDNQIYSCSWGPPDNGQAMEAPGVLIQRSMLNAVQKGRGGRGSIYVFAIGNGAMNDDNCNFDGYTNSIYSVSVGAIDRTGAHPWYSEACSAQLVVTYSSGAGDAIHTTDVGKDKCSVSHGGTSAAGPLVAGMYALMLEVRPELGWRDIQWITALTAVKIDQDAEWQMNTAIGKEYSHQFGYGKADAWALVEMAKSWKVVKPQAWYFSPWQHSRHDIPQGDQGLASTFEVTQEMLTKANLERLEHVTVTMNVEHTRRGDLSVELRSPSGMVSHIATARRKDASNQGYRDWTFMSVAHWGESGIGTWTVVVKDTVVNEHSGTLTDWRLRLWGESIDGTNQPLLPMPTEHDDDDHDREDAAVGTVSVAVPTETGTLGANPTDHPDRPVNDKITTTVAIALTETPSLSSSTFESTATPLPTHVDEGDKQDEVVQQPSSTASSAATTSPALNFLPHPFPTFGVSKSTQIWIYGAIALILIFLLCLGAWLLYMRRKKRWMSRDDYGFEMVDRDDHDGDALLSGANGRRKGRKTRAGELYDAFREGSDDEDGIFDLGDDDEDEDEDEEEEERHGRHNEKSERYRDHESTREGLDVE